MAAAQELEQEYEPLFRRILSFPVPKGLPKINLLLFGGVGAGKSSLVSTVDSLCKGRMSRRAPHGQGTGSYTRMLTKYSFKAASVEGDAKEAPFSLWDCAGWTDHEYQSGEPGFILDGNLPDRFDLSQAISPQSRDFVTAPDLADRVHCVCFIVPCEAASDQEYMKRLKQMKKFAMDRGIPTLVFLTKIDQYDTELGANFARLDSSQRLIAIMKEVASLRGSGGTKDVFPVKSFSNEYEPDQAVGVLILRALQHALYAAEDYLEDAHSKQRRPPSASQECYKATADWEALPLKDGNLYYVDQVIDDGWVRGTDAVSNKTGMFPKAFVELLNRDPPAAPAAPSARR